MGECHYGMASIFIFVGGKDPLTRFIRKFLRMDRFSNVLMINLIDLVVGEYFWSY